MTPALAHGDHRAGGFAGMGPLQVAYRRMRQDAPATIQAQQSVQATEQSRRPAPSAGGPVRTAGVNPATAPIGRRAAGLQGAVRPPRLQDPRFPR